MPAVTIKNFKGVHLDESKWADGYARYVVGLDIWGTAKNPSKISYPGVLQGIFQISAGTQAASPSAVTELITGFATYSGNTYAIGSANPGRLYYRNGSTWTWLSGVTVSAAASPTANLQVYAGNLYYAQQAYLGQYGGGSTGNANWNAFSGNTVNPRPMRVFNGNLYVGENQNIAKYDGTTWTNNALVLPSDFVVKSIEVFANRLAIMADNAALSRLYFWDGRSPTIQEFFNLIDEAIAPTLQIGGGKLWIIANRGGTTTGAPIYLFDGANFEKIQTIPVQRQITAGTTEFAGGLAIGSQDGSTGTFEDGIAGVWLINRHSQEYPYQTILGFPMRDSVTNKTIGAIFATGNGMYIGAQDVGNSTYEIFETKGSNANATNIWQSNPIDAGSDDLKMWHAIQINADTIPTGSTLVIKYRLDYATAFTTLRTYAAGSTTSQMAIYLPIGATSRTIDIRLELTASASETVRVHSFQLTYSAASN